MSTTPTDTQEAVVMSEKSIVNKYTLVPLGAVLAAVLLTWGISNSWRGETDRILVLETKQTAQDQRISSMSEELSLIKSKLESTNATLVQMSNQLAVMNHQLTQIGKGTVAAPPRNP